MARSRHGYRYDLTGLRLTWESDKRPSPEKRGMHLPHDLASNAPAIRGEKSLANCGNNGTLSASAQRVDEDPSRTDLTRPTATSAIDRSQLAEPPSAPRRESTPAAHSRRPRPAMPRSRSRPPPRARAQPNRHDRQPPRDVSQPHHPSTLWPYKKMCRPRSRSISPAPRERRSAQPDLAGVLGALTEPGRRARAGRASCRSCCSCQLSGSSSVAYASNTGGIADVIALVIEVPS
jgi:hypothetical protein